MRGFFKAGMRHKNVVGCTTRAVNSKLVGGKVNTHVVWRSEVPSTCYVQLCLLKAKVIVGLFKKYYDVIRYYVPLNCTLGG